MGFSTDIDDDLRSIMAGEFAEDEQAELVSDSYSVLFSGIFDKTYLTIGDDGAPVQSDNPQIGCFIKDIDTEIGHELSEKDIARIIIRGVTYRIDHVERDGGGYGRILLKKF